MVKKIILSVIIIFIFSSVFVYAGGIPSYDDFDDGDVSAYAVDMSDNESADTYYVNGENGRLAIHMGGGAYYWIRIQKEFTPVVTGTLIAEFSLFLPEGSYMLNYRGFPIFADLDGNEIGMVKIWGSGGSDVKINDVPIENFRFEPGKEYRCKIELDLDRGMFRFFVDDGAGYIQKFTQDNKNEFAYGGRGVKKIMFSCETYPDSPNLIYLDDIYIHMNERYVYVSPEGSDQNDGSFKNPFATAQRALEEKDAVIMFLKGTHILGDSFTYGPVDLNETPNARVMMPMYEEGIYVDGDFKTEEIPELEGLTSQNLIDSFFEDLSGNYIRDYTSKKLNIVDFSVKTDEEDNFKVSASLSAGNNSAADGKCTMIMVIYDKNNTINRVETKEITVKPYSVGTYTIESVIEETDLENLGNVKVFLWNSVKNMMPIAGPLLAGMVSLENNGGEFITNLSYSINENGGIVISGRSSANNNIGIKIADMKGNIVYLNQIKADSEGSFLLTASLKEKQFGRCRVTVSSDSTN